MERQARLVTVFGGSGFIGTQVVQDLAQRGWRVRVAVRRPDLAGHLRPLGMVGQIQPVQANIRDDASVAAALRHADAVVNLAGIAVERGRQRFASVHVEGAGRVAAIARAAGVPRLVQVSALGADSRAPSLWARSKADGEAAVRAAFPDAVIMRPALVFGAGDGFVTRVATWARLLPALPLVAGATRVQPVYVGDVAASIARAVAGEASPGATYELGGPLVLTYRDLVGRILTETYRPRAVLPLPAGLARLLAVPQALLSRPVLTADQIRLMQTETLVSEAAFRAGATLPGLGIEPVALDAVLPGYLWPFRPRGQFDRAPA